MTCHVRFTPIPQTQLTFINVPMVPVRTRKGETRYLCATWGGAMHLFDAEGREQIIPYPEGGTGSYSFTHAQYGKLGGALVRVDPQTETAKVWRNLVPDHNPTGLRVDAERRRVYVGTTLHADCGSAPPASPPRRGDRLRHGPRGARVDRATDAGRHLPHGHGAADA